MSATPLTDMQEQAAKVQAQNRNRRVVLAARPRGAPVPSDFRVEDVEVPVPQDGELLLRTLYLSLDPYMRARMSEAESYAAPMALAR